MLNISGGVDQRDRELGWPKNCGTDPFRTERMSAMEREKGSGITIITIYQRLSVRGADNREHNGVAFYF